MIHRLRKVKYSLNVLFNILAFLYIYSLQMLQFMMLAFPSPALAINKFYIYHTTLVARKLNINDQRVRPGISKILHLINCEI